MVAPAPGIAVSLVIVRSGLIVPKVLSALKLTVLRSMLLPATKWLPWPKSSLVLVACREPPSVVAWFDVRSSVPYAVAAQVLPLPGGQGIGLPFWSRKANWSRNAVVTGFGRGNPSSARHR